MLTPGTSVFIVKDKNFYSKCFGEDSSFTFYKNEYTGENDVVDYKDWIIGLGRRNNAIRLFFTYKYYGLKQLQEHIRGKIQYSTMIEKWVKKHHDLYEVFAGPYFGYISFQVKNKEGKVCNQTTKRIADLVRNIPEGFITPAQLCGFYIIRIIVGNPNTTVEVVQKFLEAVLKVTIKEREK